ncbi:S-4TM family putative pore-forming effector, partial [Klebsiella pneumoniae]|uniref:S-4TM family putative pore-forming effector n=1 Tax=Klebsiella pneumoniae TaxID=573 RepID=UPI001D0D9805
MLTIAFGFFVNMSMQEYIIKILLPSMSILIYGFKTSDELKKQSNKLEALGNSIINKFDTGNLSEINA